MEENIIYNDVVKIERANDGEQNNIIEMFATRPAKPRKEPTAQDPFADIDFGED